MQLSLATRISSYKRIYSLIRMCSITRHTLSQRNLYSAAHNRRFAIVSCFFRERASICECLHRGDVRARRNHTATVNMNYASLRGVVSNFFLKCFPEPRSALGRSLILILDDARATPAKLVQIAASCGETTTKLVN